MTDGFLLDSTPTGVIPTGHVTPEVPVIPTEIVTQASEAAHLGANFVHPGAREPRTGGPRAET